MIHTITPFQPDSSIKIEKLNVEKSNVEAEEKSTQENTTFCTESQNSDGFLAEGGLLKFSCRTLTSAVLSLVLAVLTSMIPSTFMS